jgi:hypothetical protein
MDAILNAKRLAGRHDPQEGIVHPVAGIKRVSGTFAP